MDPVCAAVASNANWARRDTMEDFWILDSVNQDVVVFAVFDGHGGPDAAAFLASHFIPEFQSCFQGDLAQALVDTHSILDQKLQASVAGSTTAVLVMRDRMAWSANLGDSRIVAWDGSRCIQMSVDHVPQNPVESNFVLNQKNGFIRHGRVNGCLAVTRSLGDADFGLYLKREPHVSKITDPVFVVLASDGLWDVLTNDDVCAFVLAHFTESVQTIATGLVDLAMQRGTADNVVCIVVVKPNTAIESPSKE